MQQVTIIGHRTLLGSHLVKAFNDTLPDVQIHFWEYGINRMDTLPTALQNCELVFNLHDLQDLRNVPDPDRLRYHNEQFVAYLMRCCHSVGCRRIVHLSTVYLQASVSWPNVHSREVEQFRKFRDQCPFLPYCESKNVAENYLRREAAKAGKDAIFSVIARVGPLYGEGDRRSFVCDAMLFTQMFGGVPLVGDQGGTLQFTYAGNAAHALLQCAKQFFDDELPIYGTETVLISDGTPLKDFYSVLLDPIEAADKLVGDSDGKTEADAAVAANNDDDDKNGPHAATTTTTVGEEEKEEMEQTNGGDPIRIFRLVRIPFFVFYILYYLFVVFFARLFAAVSYKMPGPSLFYMLFRNWTFFSNFKLSTFFRFEPPFDWVTSLRRSRRYYRQLRVDQIEGFSWMPAF